MEQENNKLSILNGNTVQAYSSVTPKTEDEKKKLFNALENCDVLLNDCVGQEITMKDIYCEKRDTVDETTGEIKPKYRCIIFDENGKSYATGSYGVYNVLIRLCQVFGEPTWENGLKVQVYKRPIGNGKQSLSLKLI